MAISDVLQAASALAAEPGNPEHRRSLCLQIYSIVRGRLAHDARRMKRLGWQECDIQDILQQAMTRAFQVAVDRCENNRGLGQVPAAFCYGVVRICLANELKRATTHGRRRRRIGEVGEQLAGTGVSPLDTAVSSDSVEVLLDSIERLTPRERTLISLRIADLSFREIGLRLDLKPSAARVALHRVLNRLRENLDLTDR